MSRMSRVSFSVCVSYLYLCPYPWHIVVAQLMQRRFFCCCCSPFPLTFWREACGRGMLLPWCVTLALSFLGCMRNGLSWVKTWECATCSHHLAPTLGTSATCQAGLGGVGRGASRKPKVSLLSDLEHESIQLAFTGCLLYAGQGGGFRCCPAKMGI